MKTFSRRTFLVTTTAVAGSWVLPGSAQDTAKSTAAQATASSAGMPPLADRLPANPLVIVPTQRPGQQGGTWNHALVGGGSLSMLFRYQAYEPLLRFTPAWDGVEPNVAESYEVSDDSTVYTFHLRKGHKWSDGAPFTTEDIRFWYEDIYTNEEVTGGIQGFWKAGGEVGKLAIVDEATFTVTFAEPNGFFAQQIAWANQDQMTRAPAHYLKRYHLKYNPDAEALAREEGFEGWVAMFQKKHGLVPDDNVYFLNSSARPTLTAWMFTTAPGDDTEKVVAVRNPYYFKVDTEGTQLPYFNEIRYQMVSDPEVLLLKTLQGEVDMIDQYICTPNNKPVLFDGQEAGNYHFYTLKETAANVMVFQLNLNHTDETKNALFNDKRFRQALSLAVDRQALIDAVFVGQGAPAQPSIVQGDPLYNERLATQFTDYDPEQANAMLDEILPEKDADGFRLDASGKRLTLVFEIDQARSTFLDMMQLALPNFQDVGIDAQMRTMDRSLWETRVRNGRDYDATCHQFGANAGVAAMLDARYFVPFNSNALYAPGWNLYYREPNNPDAIEPPAAVKAQQELYKRLLATGDQAQQRALMSELLENAADLFLTFGVSLPPDGYGVVTNDMVNTMDTMPNSFGWPTPAPSRPEQFFKA